MFRSRGEGLLESTILMHDKLLCMGDNRFSLLVIILLTLYWQGNINRYTYTLRLVSNIHMERVLTKHLNLLSPVCALVMTVMFEPYSGVCFQGYSNIEFI